MEYRRREPRFESDQPITLTNLERPGVSIHGRLINFSASGTRMVLGQAVLPGTMVRVELGGTILLGEIIYCTPEGNEFAAGLELEDALYEREMLESISGAWAMTAPVDR
jgi:hypothetical protein